MTTEKIHTCSYECERPGCIRAQRDELVSRLEALTAAQRPAAPSETVNVVGMPEFDSLLDHIYEYGTGAEGVVERANAFARAVIARYTPQQSAAVDEAMVERACRHWYSRWDEADQATKMLWAEMMYDLLAAALA
ncbi:MAG TPA: hypothetical protein VIK69_06105, partial [Methylophilaceae bacterium]